MPWFSCIVSNVLLALLLALAALVTHRWLRRPAVAHILWVLALVKLVTPPLLSVPVCEAPRDMACTLGVCSCGPHTPTQSFMRDTLPWLLLTVWLAGASATSLIACGAGRAFDD